MRPTGTEPGGRIVDVERPNRPGCWFPDEWEGN
jgi:hypothetical protein